MKTIQPITALLLASLWCWVMALGQASNAQSAGNARSGALADDPERGDVPGWVMITLVTD